MFTLVVKPSTVSGERKPSIWVPPRLAAFAFAVQSFGYCTEYLLAVDLNVSPSAAGLSPVLPVEPEWFPLLSPPNICPARLADVASLAWLVPAVATGALLLEDDEPLVPDSNEPLSK